MFKEKKQTDHPKECFKCLITKEATPLEIRNATCQSIFLKRIQIECTVRDICQRQLRINCQAYQKPPKSTKVTKVDEI